MYIRLDIPIYTHICTVLVPERCMRPQFIHTQEAGVHATPS